MNHNDLINRLVNRKVQSKEHDRAICVCMMRRLCFAASSTPARSTNAKK